MKNFIRKSHKWLGLILAFIIVLFSVSGIILNHRDVFSSVDITRKYLPRDYRYVNWNNAAIKSTTQIGDDSILVYGNIGVWLTDSCFGRFKDFNNGFPEGVDNRKIFRILKTEKSVFAGTLYGLFKYDYSEKCWMKLPLPVKDENVTDLIRKGDSILALTRSHLLVSTDQKVFTEVLLPEPRNYDHKVSMFKTLWMIHSGEIYGKAGKLMVDVVALIFIFLSVGGCVLFFSKRIIRKHKTGIKKYDRQKRVYRFNFKWHHKIGWITAVFLLFTTLTGMFLRPPLLIAIADSRIKKLPHTGLDTPNPWFDVLRRIVYIPQKKIFIISTSEGFYSFDNQFRDKAVLFETQPPASVMGVNVLEYEGNNTLLVGSFNGLFRWNFVTGELYDCIKKQSCKVLQKKGRPVGEYKITGFTNSFHHQFITFDYSRGAFNLSGTRKFTDMPENIVAKSPLSLWNLALEFHTARIYRVLVGDFYILIIPLGGVFILLLLVSGIIRGFKINKKSSNIQKSESKQKR